MTKSNSILSEVQKIRYYVMNLIYHHGDQSVRISSSRELADEFGVARSTVRIALEKMTEEGYLIARQGIGTFTNPLMAFRFAGGKCPALIGIKLFRGDHFYFDAPLLRTLSQLMWSLAGRNYSARLLTAGCNNGEDIKRELENSYVDATVCYGADPEYIVQAAERLPTLSIGVAVDGVSAIEFNLDQAGETLVLELQRTNPRPKILWSTSLRHDEFRAVLEQRPEIELVDEAEDALDSSSATPLPDAMIVQTDRLEEMQERLKAIPGGLERCRLVVTTVSPSNLPYWLLESPRREACDLASELMGSLLANPKQVVRHSLDYTLLPMNMGPGGKIVPGASPGDK